MGCGAAAPCLGAHLLPPIGWDRFPDTSDANGSSMPANELALEVREPMGGEREVKLPVGLPPPTNGAAVTPLLPATCTGRAVGGADMTGLGGVPVAFC